MYTKELIKGKKWLAVGEGPRDPVTGKRKQIGGQNKKKPSKESVMQ
ncbi:hypothetical protein [Bacillus sp. A1(2020)]|nr:hypothetical protein [Bacillus sp. A1(2020)]